MIGQVTEKSLKPILDDVPAITNWAETVEKYLAARCQYVVLWFHPKVYVRLMEKFSREVMPSFT